MAKERVSGNTFFSQWSNLPEYGKPLISAPHEHVYHRFPKILENYNVKVTGTSSYCRGEDVV